MHRRRKLQDYYNIIDDEARESISLSKIILLVIKCIYGFNHFRIRSMLIHNNETEESYPRFSTAET